MHSKYSIYKWRQTVDNRVLDHNGDLGYDYDECVDVANNYANYIGIEESYGNAKDLNYARDCDWVPNEPNNFPGAGCIVIWNGYPSDPEFGHVAVSLHRCNPYKLRAQSQNFPDGSNCHVVIFSYQGVKGWWKPRHKVIV